MPPKKTIKSAPGKPPAKRAYKPRPYKRAAPVRSYYGHGDYIKAPRAIRASKATQKTLGGTIGAHLGHGLQTVIKALTGFGDYEVASNSLMSPTLGGDPPIIKNTNNNSHVIHHREYVGDIYASGAFQNASYPINPGLIGSFPWLAQIADSYEQYKFRGAVMEFKSMCSDAVLSTSASGALGTVIMSTQYNVLEAPFADKRSMENYEYANSCKPSCSMLHPIECKMSQTSVAELYVRTAGITQGDLRLYDLGTFSIAVQGMQNTLPNQVIGELWCSFEVEFFKPKLLVGGGALLSDHYYGTGTNVITAAQPLGIIDGTIVRRSGSNLGTTIQVAAVSPYAANVLKFPSYVVDGKYLITYFMGGTTVTASSISYTASGTHINCDVTSTNVRIFGGSVNSYNYSPEATRVTLITAVQQVVEITQTTPGVPAAYQLVFPTGALPTGTTVLDLVVSQLAPSLN